MSPEAASEQPQSRYASSSPPGSRSLGYGPQRFGGLLAADAGEGEQARRGQPRFLDREGGIFLEQALQPACRDALIPGSVLAGDQDGELERVSEAELRHLFGGGHGREHVPALKRLLEDAVWPALRGRRSSSLGPEGLPSLGRLQAEAEMTQLGGPADICPFGRVPAAFTVDSQEMM